MIRTWRGWVLVLFGAAIVGLIAWAMRPQPVPVDTATIERGAMRVTVDEDGKTRIKERYVISAPLAGHLLRPDVDPGDNAEAHETLLAVIEPRDPELLDARARSEAQARVNSAKSALQQADPNLARAKATLEQAQSDLGKEAADD